MRSWCISTFRSRQISGKCLPNSLLLNIKIEMSIKMFTASIRNFEAKHFLDKINIFPPFCNLPFLGTTCYKGQGRPNFLIITLFIYLNKTACLNLTLNRQGFIDECIVLIKIKGFLIFRRYLVTFVIDIKTNKCERNESVLSNQKPCKQATVIFCWS